MWVYDNSNLNESYSGIVSPATYSFARRVYQQVYVQFCQLMGVSVNRIVRYESVFSQMVSYIGGRMYYNLNHWHQMIKLLPGYKLNSQFLEEMMGIDPALRGQVSSRTTVSKTFSVSEILRAIYITCKMLIVFLLMDKLIRSFLKRFELKSKNISVEIGQAFTDNLPIEVVMTKYCKWEADLTRDFRIPIANDFAVMIGVGLLRRLVGESAAHKLTSGLPGVKSAQPGKQLQTILATISQNKFASQVFADFSPQIIYQKMLTMPKMLGVKKMVDQYIGQYGIRVPGELKLESLCFQTDPIYLISLIKSQLRQIPSISTPQLVYTQLPQQPTNLVIQLLTRWVQTSITRREETRFQRAVAFSLVRDIFQGLGKKLTALQYLNKASDIFYLNIEDLNKYSKLKGKYRDIVASRQKMETDFIKFDLPSRIISPTSQVKLHKFRASQTTHEKSRLIAGSVACAGNKNQISGEAVVMSKFNASKDVSGKILIAAQTDPGWTIIFPLLKGLIVERGGVLSHASIVSREFSLPCIVGASGATTAISDGQLVNMDMQTGRIWLSA